MLALDGFQVVGKFIHSAQYVIALLVAFSFTWMPLLVSTSKNVSFHKIHDGYARLDLVRRYIYNILITPNHTG